MGSTLNAYFRVIDIPLGYALTALDMDPTPSVVWIYRAVATLLLAGLAWRFLRSSWRRVRLALQPDRLVDPEEYEALVRSQSGTGTATPTAVVPPAHHRHTLDELKRTRQYDRLGELYSEMGRPREAAKWFNKARMRRRAALEWARAGKKSKAARLLLKEGDFEPAGRLFEDDRQYARAAAAYERAGKTAAAARCYRQGGKAAEAAEAYREYFAAARDAVEVRVAAAEDCLQFLDSPKGRGSVQGPARVELLRNLGACFEAGKRFDTAARVFIEAGDTVRAGEDYVRAGMLEQAAECMRVAGKTNEAARIVGRFHEERGQWSQAAAAYASAKDWTHAGDCYNKASDVVRAAECFERAGEFHRAGHAYFRGARYKEAIRNLQKVRESEPAFDASRALLGRCFYELSDFPHAAATLANHLTGKRVESGNLEYFYLLALAYEQMGKLDESRDILLKIRSVNVEFRDVTQRLSVIASRISQGFGAAATPAPNMAPTAAPAALEATRAMQTVELALDGRYHLERELGRGGMGVVYLARDSQLDRSVALKFLGALVDSSEEFRQRFIREARAAARITHPNIISIYDISASAGKAYIAMEYVDGPSLAKYIARKGALPVREAVNIVEQALSALQAIHEVGIVHRDIKPDNILISRGNLVKLTDFGLAKAEDARLTRTGMVMGTPSYMSPEQVLGKDATARSDIYSIGLVLFEALTGETAFRDGDVLERQLNEMPPAPSSLVADIPETLDEILFRSVAKKPDDRYPSAQEMLDDLRTALA